MAVLKILTITYLDWPSRWFVLRQRPLLRRFLSLVLQLLSYDFQIRELPSMRSLGHLSPHSPFHFVQPLEIPAGVGGHSQGVVRHTVRTAAVGHILADCTDRIDLEVGHPAVAGPPDVEIVVLAVVVVAAAAKEVIVAAAGLAE